MNSANSGDILQRILLAQSDPSLCASFHVAEEAGKWIQYGNDRINAAYPSQLDPSALVASLGGELESWKADKYLTVVFASVETAIVVRWVETYFRWVLASQNRALVSTLSRFQGCANRA